MMTDDEHAPPDPGALAQRIYASLAARAASASALTVATAESCTGGNVAAALTSVAGSSDYVQGGIVSYSNEVKANLLGVSRQTLATRGAVSAECAREMAEGARRIFGTDLAVSTTGIAGPGGATTRKPVGLVYIAVAGPEGVAATEHHFPGDRAAVTLAATQQALALLLAAIKRGGG
ncbi:MAG: CinA family protein [Thermomicrobiales bacterium]